jgi:hypothetical protein
VEPAGTALEDAITDPTGIENLALQSQIGQLVERIQQAEHITELKTIDDNGRVSEANMLRPQVAMALDDASALHTLLKTDCIFL